MVTHLKFSHHVNGRYDEHMTQVDPSLISDSQIVISGRKNYYKTPKIVDIGSL